MKSDKSELIKAESNSEDETSSSEDDEDAELLTEDLETKFFKVLSRLKKKDPKLYDENTRFFSVGTSEQAAQNIIHQQKERKQSEKHYKEWLKGQINKLEDDEVKNDLEALRDFWANPTLNKDDQFLRDYILNKKFLDEDKDFNIKEELAKLEEEEKEVEEALIFEHKYNYRFENSDQDFVENQREIMQKPSGKKRKHDGFSDFKPKWIKGDNKTLYEKVQIKDESREQEVKSEKNIGQAEIKHMKGQELSRVEQERLKKALAIKNELKNRNRLKKKLKEPSQRTDKTFEMKVKHKGAYEYKANAFKKDDPQLNKKLQMKEDFQTQEIKSAKKGGFSKRKHVIEQEALGAKAEQKNKTFSKKLKKLSQIKDKTLEMKVHEDAYKFKQNVIKKDDQQLNEKLQMKELQKQDIKSRKKDGSFAERKHIIKQGALKKALGVKAEEKKKIFSKKHKMQHRIMEKCEKKWSTPRKKRHRVLFKNKLIS